MKKGRKAFWNNIKFKYKLTIINENTLEEVIGIHVSKLNGMSAEVDSHIDGEGTSICLMTIVLNIVAACL